MSTMQVPFLAGRDFQADERNPGAALVNQTFVQQFFAGESAIGRTFAKGTDRYRVVGVVGDVPYRSVREATLPVAYVPLRAIDLSPRSRATIVVRTTSQSPLALAPLLRQELTRARSELRTSNIRTQQEIVDAQTVRDRLLAMLALFFTVVAVMLAGVGLYGVLEYSVTQLRRDIGIRLALGAGTAHIARRVALRSLLMIGIGAVAGLALSLQLSPYAETMLFGVKSTEAYLLALPAVIVLVVALLAAAVPVARASRTDPVVALRAE
jgi:putative ABC transport system permease protein